MKFLFAKAKRYPKTAVFLAYLILTLVLTYPIAFKITSEIPAEGGDAFQILRRFNLLENKIYHFFSPEKYPSEIIGETEFEKQSMRNFFLWLSMPFPLIFGNTAGYNIIWLLSFALAGFSMYLLIDFLIGDKKAALFGGFIYAFSPYHFAHGAGHFYAMHIEWLPFYFLFLFKFIKKPNWKNGALTLLFFLLVGVTDAQYLILSAVLTILLVIYYLLRKPHLILNKKLIKIAFLTTVLALVVLYLQYSAYIQIATGEENFLKPKLVHVKNYSADLFSIITPSYFHPLWGNFFYQNVSRHFSGNIIENTTFAGWLVLLLALYGFIYASKEKNVFFFFWGIIFLIFFLVALGPFLNILGQSQNFKFPLPYLLFYKIIPFFDHCRTASRNFIIALLALVILASYGLKNFPKPIVRKNLFLYIFSIFIFIEFLALPYPTQGTEVPATYFQIKEEKESFKILEIPASKNQDAYSEALFYQTIHQKEIIGGIPLARQEEQRFDFERQTPIVRELLYKDFQKPLPKLDIFNQNYKDIAETVFSYYNIKYIILHKKYLSEEETKNISQFIEDNLESQREELKELVIFKIALEKPKVIFMKRGKGFESSDFSSGRAKGVIKSGWAEIFVVNPQEAQEAQKRMLFFCLEPEKEGVLRLSSEQKTILEANISAAKNWYNIGIELKEGENKLIFEFEPKEQKVLIWNLHLKQTVGISGCTCK